MQNDQPAPRAPLTEAESARLEAYLQRNAELLRIAVAIEAWRTGHDFAPPDDVRQALAVELAEDWPEPTTAEADSTVHRRYVSNAVKRAARRVAPRPSARRVLRKRVDIAEGLRLAHPGVCPVSELAASELLRRLGVRDRATVALELAMLAGPRAAKRALVRVAAWLGIGRGARRTLFAELMQVLASGERGRLKIAKRISRLRRRLRATGFFAGVLVVAMALGSARSTQSHGESSAADGTRASGPVASTQSAREDRWSPDVQVVDAHETHPSLSTQT